MRSPFPSILLAIALIGAAMPVSAQQTRQGIARQQREEKARRLRPYRPDAVEAGLIRLEEGRYLERLFSPRNGIFPRIGGATPGAGLVLGPGYRATGLFGGKVDLLASAAVSNKRYWLVEASVGLPRLARGRAFAELYVAHRDFPQEDYYGLGPESTRPARTNYSLRQNSLQITGGVRPAAWLAAGTRVEFLSPTIGRGTDRKFPTTERLFSEADTPGLAAQPDFIRYEAFLDLNYRNPVANPTSGGRYVLSFSRYEDRDLDRFAFTRLDAELQQFIPLLYGHRVLALRALVSLSDAAEGHDVPFYLQRWLGGSHLLRGSRSFRWRDRNLLALQAEYRFLVLPVLTGALFYETGAVSAERDELWFRHMKRDYGIGLRFGGPRGVFVRTDMAWGGESPRFLLRFNDVF